MNPYDNKEKLDVLKDKKIKLFYLKRNMGPSYCRNYAISKSKSELIAFLDSDDFWSKEKLKKRTSEELLKATGVANFPIDFKLPF